VPPTIEPVRILKRRIEFLRHEWIGRAALAALGEIEELAVAATLQVDISTPST